MFEIQNLTARYGPLVAVNDVSLSFDTGVRMGIFGHNGSGKSTLLKCLVGGVRDISGAVAFDGSPIVADQVHRNVMLGIGFVPQVQNVFPNLTVEQNLHIAGSKSDSSFLEEAYALFPLLRERQDQFAGDMSGGEQQMLAVALALMTRPQILLLDEPTAGLAPAIVKNVLGSLSRINSELGTGLILVEQNVLAALDVVERAIVLKGGRVVFDGASEELRAKEDLWAWF